MYIRNFKYMEIPEKKSQKGYYSQKIIYLYGCAFYLLCILDTVFDYKYDIISNNLILQVH